jgi:hypothetical protein
MLKLLTLDSNIFISETKGNEEYSDKCSDIISPVGRNISIKSGANRVIVSFASLELFGVDFWKYFIICHTENFDQSPRFFIKSAQFPINLYSPLLSNCYMYCF